jgi:hypothetical protein
MGQREFRHVRVSLPVGLCVLAPLLTLPSEYILHAADIEVDRWNQRGIGLACITSAFLIHGLALKWGIRLQNLLGFIKVIIILVIVVCGWVALAGHLKLPKGKKPHNFTNAFEGTTGSAYGVVTALYNVIWSYIGYSNANYALSETRNPVRTLRIAAPLAIGVISVLYMFVNIAYFAAVPKDEIIAARRLVAASLFRNVFGGTAERALCVFVALSAYGNVLSVIFSQGRLVQELGREGILPFSRFWASNRPFNAPLAGLFEHWLVSVIIMLAPPPGDAYNFILKCVSLCPTKSDLIANVPCPVSSRIPSPSSTSLSPAASSTSTCAVPSGTGPHPSAPRCPSSCSFCSATSTSSSPRSCRPRAAKTSTSACRIGSTASWAPASSSPAASTGSSGRCCFPSWAGTSWRRRRWSTRLTVGRETCFTRSRFLDCFSNRFRRRVDLGIWEGVWHFVPFFWTDTMQGKEGLDSPAASHSWAVSVLHPRSRGVFSCSCPLPLGDAVVTRYLRDHIHSGNVRR